MPFSAIIEGKKTISLKIEYTAWLELFKRHQKGELPITMPCCQQPGHMRISPNGIRHFYHANECPNWEPESIEHLETKAEIYRICSEEGWECDTEVPGNGWRADVLAKKKRRTIAFEVQLSHITPSELEMRTRRYERDGIEVYWLFEHIINEKQIKEWMYGALSRGLANLKVNLERFFFNIEGIEAEFNVIIRDLNYWNRIGPYVNILRHFKTLDEVVTQYRWRVIEENRRERIREEEQHRRDLQEIKRNEQYIRNNMPQPSIFYQSYLFKWGGAHLSEDERFFRDCRLQTQWERERGLLWKG